MEIVLLILSLAAILTAAHVFTNGIEWLGIRLDLPQAAVGSVLAAIGTALPESIIPVVAVLLRGGETGTEIGVGAILGAPFMLGTLAFLVSGLAVVYYAWRRRRPGIIQVDRRAIGRDLRFFLGAYTIAVAAAFLPVRGGKIAIALALLLFYALYLRRTFAGRGDGGAGEPEPLLLAPRHHRPGMVPILVQVLGGASIIVAGAHFFVGGLEALAGRVGFPPFLMSLIVAPIATELPEKFNSVLWLGRQKDTLALGNITGAMVFQSSVIPALGIFLTSWSLDVVQALPALLALLSALIVYAMVRRHGRIRPPALLLGGVIYAIYLAIAL